MLGVPLDGPAWMFGDNQAMINSSMLPEGRLTKRSVALSYHRVREAVAAGIMYYFHVDGKINISDCMTKLLSNRILSNLIKPVLFWQGDTRECGRINLHIQGNKITLIPIEPDTYGSDVVPIGECQPVFVMDLCDVMDLGDMDLSDMDPDMVQYTVANGLIEPALSGLDQAQSPDSITSTQWGLDQQPMTMMAADEDEWFYQWNHTA